MSDIGGKICCKLLQVKQKKVKRRKIRDRTIKKDKYAQMKRFHYELQLQVYMHDFMYVYPETISKEDYFPATFLLLLKTTRTCQLQDQFPNIGLDLVTYVQKIMSYIWNLMKHKWKGNQTTNLAIKLNYFARILWSLMKNGLLIWIELMVKPFWNPLSNIQSTDSINKIKYTWHKENHKQNYNKQWLEYTGCPDIPWKVTNNHGETCTSKWVFFNQFCEVY